MAIRKVVASALFTAIDKVIEQGGRCTLFSPESGKEVCMYRGLVNGEPACCLAGHIIKDEFYQPDFERHSTINFGVKSAICSSVGIPQLHPIEVDIITCLQRCHDNMKDIPDFIKNCTEVLLDYNLPTTTKMREVLTQ